MRKAIAVAALIWCAVDLANNARIISCFTTRETCEEFTLYTGGRSVCLSLTENK